MKHIFKYCGLGIVALGTLMTSCDDSYPSAPASNYLAEIKEIRIVNGGMEGDSLVLGTVDSQTKQITFPRLSQHTKNLGALKIEATFEGESYLEGDTYDFDMDIEEGIKSRLIKVLNRNKYTVYNMTVQLKVPLKGADFAKPIGIYNYAGTTPYPNTGGTIRGTAFDGEHILIVERGGTGPHLLKVSDVEKGLIKPILLNQTGVTGGTFAVNMGALAGGKVYVANLSTTNVELSGSVGHILKVYCWEDPQLPPKVILKGDKSKIDGVGARHGDNFSMDLDNNGNGYMFFAANAEAQVLRFTVNNFTEVSSPSTFPIKTKSNGFMSITRIGYTNEYLQGGKEQVFSLVSENGIVANTISDDFIAAQAMEPRMFTFNRKRYLAVTAAQFTGSNIPTGLYVYDFGRGETVTEAFDRFVALKPEERSTVYNLPLGGAANANPAAQTAYHITKDAEGKDEFLYLFSARTASGWALAKFPLAPGIED